MVTTETLEPVTLIGGPEDGETYYTQPTTETIITAAETDGIYANLTYMRRSGAQIFDHVERFDYPPANRSDRRWIGRNDPDPCSTCGVPVDFRQGWTVITCDPGGLKGMICATCGESSTQHLVKAMRGKGNR